jgi:hypothetical protein
MTENIMLLDRQKGNDMQLAIKKLSLYKLCLIFSGIGIAMVLSSLIVSIYYNMINAIVFGLTRLVHEPTISRLGE